MVLNNWKTDLPSPAWWQACRLSDHLVHGHAKSHRHIGLPGCHDLHLRGCFLRAGTGSTRGSDCGLCVYVLG